MPKEPFIPSKEPWSDEERQRITGVLNNSASLAQMRRRQSDEAEADKLYGAEYRRIHGPPPTPDMERAMLKMTLNLRPSTPDGWNDRDEYLNKHMKGKINS